MKHASPETLQRLASLRARLRAVPGLVERRPGIFHLRSSAFLHFHEDPAGLFADVKLDGVEFTRRAVDTAQQQNDLIRAAADVAAKEPTRRRRPRAS